MHMQLLIVTLRRKAKALGMRGKPRLLGVSLRLSLWRPKFLNSIISARTESTESNPVDIGQTLVNLGHHLENRVNNP
jgi:hypothetical protein